MKTFAKIISLAMALCLLVSLVAIPASAAGYQQPKFTIGKFTERPNIDGKLDDTCWKYATEREFTKEKLLAGEGHLMYKGVEVESSEGFPNDGEGWAYFGWDEDYFYFGLEIDDDKNTNTQAVSDQLWKDDCLQIQIGASILDERYELGFALSQFGGNRPLCHQWEPVPEDIVIAGTTQMTDATNNDVVFYVGRDNRNKLTTYEFAINLNYIGAKAGEIGNKIPFAFLIHLYDPVAGPFLEWADGVWGNAQTKDLTVAALLEFAAANTKPNSSLGGGDKPIATTTTKKPTTTTKKTTTATTAGKTDATTAGKTNATTAPQGGSNNVVTAAPTTTTAAPTTTTTAPEVAGTEFFDATKAVDVDDADTLATLGEGFEGIEISAKKYTVKEKNFGVFAGETLKGVFVKDGDKFVALEGKEEEIEGSKWMIYEVEADTEVYVVEEVIPTTTPAPTTTTEAEVEATTTAATTKAADTTTEPASNGWIVWVIVAVAVLAAAAVVVIIVLKKKNAAPTEE